MIKITVNDVVFHFNKKHLEDPTIPMWVLKTKGKSFYVNHVDCQCPWSTKETENNPHTKGSIKIKNCTVIIDDDNNATIAPKEEEEDTKEVTKESEKVITLEGEKLKKCLSELEIEHGPIIAIGGECRSTFYITEIMDKSILSMLFLNLGGRIRILMPNEEFYKIYERKKGAGDNEFVDIDDEYEEKTDRLPS